MAGSHMQITKGTDSKIRGVSISVDMFFFDIVTENTSTWNQIYWKKKKKKKKKKQPLNSKTITSHLYPSY